MIELADAMRCDATPDTGDGAIRWLCPAKTGDAALGRVDTYMHSVVFVEARCFFDLAHHDDNGRHASKEGVA